MRECGRCEHRVRRQAPQVPDTAVRRWCSGFTVSDTGVPVLRCLTPYGSQTPGRYILVLGVRGVSSYRVRRQAPQVPDTAVRRWCSEVYGV